MPNTKNFLKVILLSLYFSRTATKCAKRENIRFLKSQLDMLHIMSVTLYILH